MKIDNRISLGCLGKIHRFYNQNDRCRELCPFTALCIFLLMGELLTGKLLNDGKRPGDTCCQTDDEVLGI